uniref:C2H2-type domain-containing protein n=1 Tax=Zosterops lateralis melanops TaxID=1220523 RepID=A0A8D2QVD7_ZOSLA
MGDDRPFVCGAPGCGQRFTNEDHLAVHKHKHEMTLKFGPARTDSVIIADQTPTPTRFLKNCEEVGLFNELASSFEHEFKKAAEDDEKKARRGAAGKGGFFTFLEVFLMRFGVLAPGIARGDHPGLGCPSWAWL